jgi:predicted nucleic acid-binding protein
MPEFAFAELNLYREVVKQKTKLDEDQFRNYAYTVFSLIKFLPTFIQKDKSSQQAIKLCRKVDIKDVSYVSLAIDTDLILLTRDVKLYKGLQKQGFKQVELFEDFLNGI